MRKTVADYPEKDWHTLAGMWCEIPTERGLRVITGIETGRVNFIDPTHPRRWGSAGAGCVTIRTDLQPAWECNGEPLDAGALRTEYTVQHPSPNVMAPLPVATREQGLAYIEQMNAAGIDAAKDLRVMRRRISDWETC